MWSIRKIRLFLQFTLVSFLAKDHFTTNMCTHIVDGYLTLNSHPLTCQQFSLQTTFSDPHYPVITKILRKQFWQQSKLHFSIKLPCNFHSTSFTLLTSTRINLVKKYYKSYSRMSDVPKPCYDDCHHFILAIQASTRHNMYNCLVISLGSLLAIQR